MIFVNLAKQKDKNPWRWCRCIEICRSTYDIWNTLYIYICCAFVGLENKLYTMHGTYIKIAGTFVYIIHTNVRVWWTVQSMQLYSMSYSANCLYDYVEAIPILMSLNTKCDSLICRSEGRLQQRKLLTWRYLLRSTYIYGTAVG